MPNFCLPATVEPMMLKASWARGPTGDYRHVLATAVGQPDFFITQQAVVSLKVALWALFLVGLRWSGFACGANEV